MNDTSAYDIRIMHAGRELTADEAAQYVSEGSRVFVSAFRDGKPARSLLAAVALADDGNYVNPRAYVDYTVSTQNADGAALTARISQAAADLAEAADSLVAAERAATRL